MPRDARHAAGDPDRLAGIRRIPAGARAARAADLAGVRHLRRRDIGSKWDDPNFGTGSGRHLELRHARRGPVQRARDLVPERYQHARRRRSGLGHPLQDRRGSSPREPSDAAVQRAMDTGRPSRISASCRWPIRERPSRARRRRTSASLRTTFPRMTSGPAHPGGRAGDDLQFPDALSVDLVLNDRNRFTIAAGPDGTPIPTDQGVYLNDSRIRSRDWRSGRRRSAPRHAGRDRRRRWLLRIHLPGATSSTAARAASYTHVNHVLDRAGCHRRGMQGDLGQAAHPEFRTLARPWPPAALEYWLQLQAMAPLRGSRLRSLPGAGTPVAGKPGSPRRHAGSRRRRLGLAAVALLLGRRPGGACTSSRPEVETLALDDRARAERAASRSRSATESCTTSWPGPAGGDAVVFLHGFSTPYLIWDPNFPALAAAGYQAAALRPLRPRLLRSPHGRRLWPRPLRSTARWS